MSICTFAEQFLGIPQVDTCEGGHKSALLLSEEWVVQPLEAVHIARVPVGEGHAFEVSLLNH